MQKFNAVTRRKIHSNLMETKETLDFSPTDPIVCEKLREVIHILGLKGIDDTATKLKWGAVSADSISMVERIVDDLDSMDLKVQIRSNEMHHESSRVPH